MLASPYSHTLYLRTKRNPRWYAWRKPRLFPGRPLVHRPATSTDAPESNRHIRTLGTSIPHAFASAGTKPPHAESTSKAMSPQSCIAQLGLMRSELVVTCQYPLYVVMDINTDARQIDCVPGSSRNWRLSGLSTRARRLSLVGISWT